MFATTINQKMKERKIPVKAHAPTMSDQRQMHSQTKRQ